jgi:2-methylcitrate dehydratase PrpD
LESAILASSAAARSTEMDDIHLASCTTPGSVVVPTALALASAGDLVSPRTFLSAIATGYELLIRLGLAIDGPAVLSKQVWPTLFAASLGSAATAARTYGLSIAETAGAFATALAFSTGTAIRPPSPTTSRWLTLGAATWNGVLAVRAARAGMLGNRDLLEQRDYRLSGI